MAQLIATLPAAIAHAIRDRLTRFAHSVVDARPAPGPPVAATIDADRHTSDADRRAAEAAHRSGDTDHRTVEQVRADVLADLLLTADPTAAPRSPQPITAVVQVVVPVLTLLGDRDGTGEPVERAGPAGRAGPAELAGRAPIDTATARHLAGSAPGWDRILTHPVTGTVLAVDRYRPSEQQRRHLRARDERCRFPGCRMPVHRCDVDHTTDAALGGATSTCNLAHLCRRHHSLKHATDWTVTQRSDGTLEWTSPTGRVHLDHPPSTVRFRASSDPPPF
ncbi:HNH endonuclease signature motif containing protein [Microbacterium sp. Root180]|uniref:HNH endonuclease signature motif containing protein n=1 Tax=Microbacterium sp. Root180 TaxID=1736483 RepID=UPI002285B68D|nr:HNH endonuclease signature motif containing protein [Microbacterium sp. Root180]